MIKIGKQDFINIIDIKKNARVVPIWIFNFFFEEGGEPIEARFIL